MSRADRIRKLSNAIKAYRGVNRMPPIGGVGPVWEHSPQPARRDDIVRHLTALGISPIESALKTIDGFKAVDDFRAWINQL